MALGLVAHEVVARGADAIRARFAALRADGMGLAVVDAESNADLMLIGQALAGMKLVTAGSGIAMGLPQNWNDDGCLKQGAVAGAALAWAEAKLNDGPVLIYATAEPAAVLAVQAELGAARAGHIVENPGVPGHRRSLNS